MFKKINIWFSIRKLLKQFKYVLAIFLMTFYPSLTQAQYVYNWFPSASGTTNNLYSVSGNLCVGANGIILYTTDNGRHWSPQLSGTTEDLRSVIVPGSIAIAAGSNGIILRSTNNGVSWAQVQSGTANQLNSVARAYSTMYIAVGGNGTIVATTNSGAGWFTQQSPTSADLNCVSGFGYNAWAVGDNGILITTSNSGTNWVVRNTGIYVNLKGIHFKDLNTGWIVGSAGLILKSTNGGNNWFLQQSNTVHELNKVFSGTWICGNNGTILKSINNGMNWVQGGEITGVNLNSINMSGESGTTVGTNGNIFIRRIDSSFLPCQPFTPNNIWTLFNNSGIFNQNTVVSNTPGFQWPAGSGKFAVFTSGLTIAAKVNGILRMAAASYNGEYYPGYIADSSGIPVGRNDNRFRFYRIKRGDNAANSFDWLNWGLMVPFGAPFVDVDNDGIYQPAIDSPGVRGASQTLFICLTDGFPEKHSLGEGFGGGTLPLYAEVHLTAWGYDNPGYQDMQFIKWEIINKGVGAWNNTYFALFCDPDLGNAVDDYIGCDTIRNLGYCYNADNYDEGTIYSYGANPPAVGFKMLNCLGSPALTMKSFTYCECASCGGPPCEWDPNGQPAGAYIMMKGVKKDGTPWVVPNTNPPQTTKFCYSGDPETNTGWTEFGGKIWNCDSLLTGQHQIPVPPGDRRLIIGTGSESLTVNPGDTQRVTIVQLIARGSNNLNSVTLLKQLSDVAQRLCDSGFVIGVKKVSSQLPGNFKLYQNYPNPFNPVTTIKFDTPPRPSPKGREQNVRLVIYDITGREIEVLVNEELKGGTYQVMWDASNYSSGVYFYVLRAGDPSTSSGQSYFETKKMVLIK